MNLPNIVANFIFIYISQLSLYNMIILKKFRFTRYTRLQPRSIHPNFLLQEAKPKTMARTVRYNFHQHQNFSNNYLVPANDDFCYEQNLKNRHWVNDQISKMKTLLNHTQGLKNQNYKELRSSINELLLLSKYISDSRAYHELDIDLSQSLNFVSKCLKIIFSEKSNKTHQNIYEQQMSTYEFIEFSVYFELCNSWKLSFKEEILEHYLHSYMNLLFDRSLLKYMAVYEVLRESQASQIVLQIIEKSKEGISHFIPRLKDKISSSYLLNPLEMAIYLKHVRNILNTPQETLEKLENRMVLSTYILKSEESWNKSSLHFENMTYSLFLLFKIDEMKESVVLEVYDWMCQRFIQTKRWLKEDVLLKYLTTFNSHQDKITCLKIDIWLELLFYDHRMPLEMRHFNLTPEIELILNRIEEIEVSYWRYKYIIWLLDSLLNKHPGSYLPSIHRIFASLGKTSLRSNDRIISLAMLLSQITSRHTAELEKIISIHYSVSSWLKLLPKESLKNQKSSDLCELLTFADSHPTLQKIYTPYLIGLLELSLGHFAWIDLTRLYYYGLRFGVEQASQEALWNMEYVRRYILNQYATMGLSRRQIPEDSYFYKIIGISTPEKFYKNYLIQET